MAKNRPFVSRFMPAYGQRLRRRHSVIIPKSTSEAHANRRLNIMEETMAEGDSRVKVGRRAVSRRCRCCRRCRRGGNNARRQSRRRLRSARSRLRRRRASRPATPSFKPQEALFIEAVVDHMIPKDELTPSGTEIGIATYIDRALAGSWGKGDRLYMQGPWRRGHRQSGLSASAHAGRALSRRRSQAADAYCRKTFGKTFDRMHRRAEGSVPARTLRRQDHARRRAARPHLLRRALSRT